MGGPVIFRVGSSYINETDGGNYQTWYITDGSLERLKTVKNPYIINKE